MSDPRSEKVRREQEQVRAFLIARALPFARIDKGPDPPDVIVHRDDLLPLEVEVTEYHPETLRVGMEARAGQFRQTLDGLVAANPSLKGIYINSHFYDNGIPSRRHHDVIATEVVRFVEYAMNRGWVGRERHKFSFQGTRTDIIASDWIALPAERWPVLARFMSVLEVLDFPFDGYMPSACYQAQVGWCSPYAQPFAQIFGSKAEKLRNASQEGRYARGDSPLWLLIVCNRSGDLRSNIFGGWELKSAVEESGFDFADSPFDEVWLTAENLGGRSQRLFPWDDQGA